MITSIILRSYLIRCKTFKFKSKTLLPVFTYGMLNLLLSGVPILRTPSISESLAIFSSCFARPIKTVLDVGAQTKTQFLIEAFPDAFHFLFEPVKIYHPSLESNYDVAGVNYEIIPCAVSDQPGRMYQHLLSSDESGSITHSQLLSERQAEKFGPRLLDIIETQVVSLDQWATESLLLSPYVLKIDVDGVEDAIIEGAKKTISQSSLFIVESTLDKISSRVAMVEAMGMRLFDIAGNGYYFGQLSQVDLIFISSQVVQQNIEFRPWEKHGKVIWEHWQQY